MVIVMVMTTMTMMMTMMVINNHIGDASKEDSLFNSLSQDNSNKGDYDGDEDRTFSDGPEGGLRVRGGLLQRGLTFTTDNEVWKS